MHLYRLLCTEPIISIFLINAKYIFQHHMEKILKTQILINGWTFITFIWGIHANSDLKGLIMNFLIINVSWQPSRKRFCCLLLLVSSLLICKGQESLNIKLWRKDSDTAVTSHMYEGQNWLALSRRVIAEHMSSKFKRRGYLENAAFACDVFYSYSECIDQTLWAYNKWWLSFPDVNSYQF